TKKHGEFEALPGEQIIRIVQKHPVIFLLALIMPLIFTTIGLSILVFFNAHIFAVPFAVLFFAFAAVFFIKAWLDFNYDVIYVTNKRVILQDRELFGSVKNDIAYEAITNTIPQNLGISHWLLGFGHIQIETAAADGNFLFENAPDPHGVVRLIVQNRHEALEKSIGNPTIRTEITKPSVTKI
ncbi:MAG: hypothetical protein OEL89_02445, partial [Candidatus Peregrinibacteria bacterium]|nr:hypothetical protein [Candidatus Peregrinibacteria bacterium]